LTDPRVEIIREHNLEDILFIAIASVICGAGIWNDMEEFGIAKEERLKTFLPLPGGILSHDTFNRVFSAPDPEESGRCFMSRTSAVAEHLENEEVAIEGTKHAWYAYG
jgi:hypothetical protein